MSARVKIVDLGDAADAAGLLAEFDAEDDVIRVSARAARRIAAIEGVAEAQRFVACAVAHELRHRRDPNASEVEAHAAARDSSGVDPRRYEAVLRRDRG